RYDDFCNGTRCRKCKAKIRGEKRRIPKEFVKEFIDSKGCKLLSDYVNSNELLSFQCNCGEISKTSFGHFKQGVRCFKCGRKKEKIKRKKKNKYRIKK